MAGDPTLEAMINGHISGGDASGSGDTQPTTASATDPTLEALIRGHYRSRSQGPAVDMSGGFISPSGDYVPPEAMGIPGSSQPPVVAPNIQAAPPHPRTTPPPPYTALPLFPAPAPGALGRIATAAREGYEASTPAVTPGQVMSPINYGLALIPGVLGGALRAGQQFITEAFPGGLGRDIAAIAEAFPTGPNMLHPELVRPPSSTPRPTPRFVGEYYGEGTPTNPLITGNPNLTPLERITEAVRNADQPPGSQPPAPYQPPAFVPPNTSPYPPTAPRAVEAGPRPAGGDVTAYGTPLPGQPTTSTSASRPGFVPPEVQQAAMPPAGQTPPPSATPSAPSVAPPAMNPDTMTAAEILARSREGYKAPDQAATQGAMLPQDSANAIYKSVTDEMPGDPQQAKYFARGNPTVAGVINDVKEFQGQPMSYASAMELDSTLTSAIRSTKDANEQRILGNMQNAVRDQMDQLPDLDQLRPARQAYTQYIKQSQMEDMAYDAGLRPEDKQSAYLQQRMRTFLQNDRNTRNWTPEELAQAEQVAKSGDIGFLKRQMVSMVRPATRVVGGFIGHAIGGLPGAYLGAEVGSDIGTTQAARLRAHWSQTDLAPVMQQITKSVPPPNQLGPQP